MICHSLWYFVFWPFICGSDDLNSPGAYSYLIISFKNNVWIEITIAFPTQTVMCPFYYRGGGRGFIYTHEGEHYRRKNLNVPVDKLQAKLSSCRTQGEVCQGKSWQQTLVLHPGSLNKGRLAVMGGVLHGPHWTILLNHCLYQNAHARARSIPPQQMAFPSIPPMENEVL